MRSGDRIVKINGVKDNIDDMMRALTAPGRKQLEILRGPFDTPEFISPSPPQSPRVSTQEPDLPRSNLPCARNRAEPFVDNSMGRDDLQDFLAHRLAASRAQR